MSYPAIGQRLIILPSIDSTNNYAMAQASAGLAAHGTAYFALEQTAGKGQRGKSWITTTGENIMMSVVLQPHSLKTNEQFLLSAAIALGCYDFFKNYAGPETAIKWPNDIYWRDRKAGGILIENRIGGRQSSIVNRQSGDSGQQSGVGPINGLEQSAAGSRQQAIGNRQSAVPPPDNQEQPETGSQPLTTDNSPLTTWLFAIVGMGLNINQAQFAEGLLRPVSLKQITGKTHDIHALAKELCRCLEYRYQGIHDPQQLLADYHQAMYKLGQTVTLKEGNQVFETTVMGVTPSGQLITSHRPKPYFEVGEIEWMI